MRPADRRHTRGNPGRKMVFRDLIADPEQGPSRRELRRLRAEAGALFRARMADDDAQMEALASHAHRQGRARATDGAARALLDGILAVGLFALMLAGGCAVAGLAEFVSRLAAPEG